MQHSNQSALQFDSTRQIIMKTKRGKIVFVNAKKKRKAPGLLKLLGKPPTKFVIISDTHVGDQFGLVHPDGFVLDSGDIVKPRPMHLKLWDRWDELWEEWVPMVTRGEPYGVVLAGDSVEGDHHGSSNPFSRNVATHIFNAEKILKPIAEKAEGYFFLLRGTGVHDGESGRDVETLGRLLNARADENGNRTRYDLWLRIGTGLCHILHTIGFTSSLQYESTAIFKEMCEMLANRAANSAEIPDIVVRAHRHRHCKATKPIYKNGRPGECIAYVNPGWQLKTPLAFVLAGARTSDPQIGGSIIIQGDEDLYVRHITWMLEPSRIECER